MDQEKCRLFRDDHRSSFPEMVMKKISETMILSGHIYIYVFICSVHCLKESPQLTLEVRNNTCDIHVVKLSASHNKLRKHTTRQAFSPPALLRVVALLR